MGLHFQASELVPIATAIAGEVPCELSLLGPRQMSGESFAGLDKLRGEVVRGESGQEHWPVAGDRSRRAPGSDKAAAARAVRGMDDPDFAVDKAERSLS